MARKVNKYFVTIPVSSWQIAKLFSSETNWRILETLREEGIQGLTVEEISKKTRIPKSTVYSVLSRLQAGDWVESSMRRFGWGRPTREVVERFGGKPARIYIEQVPWGSTEFDEDFYENLLPTLERHKKKLRKSWLAFLDEIVVKFKTDEKLEEFFPKDAIHEKCEWSHEAHEFLLAVSIAMIEEILEDEELNKLARKHEFAK